MGSRPACLHCSASAAPMLALARDAVGETRTIVLSLVPCSEAVPGAKRRAAGCPPLRGCLTSPQQHASQPRLPLRPRPRPCPRPAQSFPGHKDAVTGLAFREGTHQLFSASLDRSLKLWSLDDMAYVDTLFGHQSEVGRGPTHGLV